MQFPTVQDQQRSLVVLAYAHAIMEDLLTDYALSGQPLPKDVDDHLRGENSENGMRYEETFLQGNAPQFSIGFNHDEGWKVRNEAWDLVDGWLRDLHGATT